MALNLISETGDEWAEAIGPMTKDKAFALLDNFVAKGGVSIDTSNAYQVGEMAGLRPEYWLLTLNSSPERTNKVRFGSASGWQIARSETKWLSLPSTLLSTCLMNRRPKS
jgi:aryl-alcohol dehydrogenase-like predicted oxidoreductase